MHASYVCRLIVNFHCFLYAHQKQNLLFSILLCLLIIQNKSLEDSYLFSYWTRWRSSASIVSSGAWISFAHFLPIFSAMAPIIHLYKNSRVESNSLFYILHWTRLDTLIKIELLI